MKGSKKVIELLNKVLTKELTAINQYFVQGKMSESWGYEALAKKYREEAIGEMKHAEKLIHRILFLDGVPNMTDYEKISLGRDVKRQLESDLGLEVNAIGTLRAGIKLALDESDHGSREILEEILAEEEEHVDWLEGQLHLIEEAGYENYLSQQIHGTD